MKCFIKSIYRSGSLTRSLEYVTQHDRQRTGNFVLECNSQCVVMKKVEASSTKFLFKVEHCHSIILANQCYSVQLLEPRHAKFILSLPIQRFQCEKLVRWISCLSVFEPGFDLTPPWECLAGYWLGWGNVTGHVHHGLRRASEF